MADPADKPEDKKKQEALIYQAIREIADTQAGVILFSWMKNRCHFERSTISGNAQTYEVNPLGSIAQEFQRRLYLEIRRGFSRSAKIKIEIGQDKPENE